MCINNVCPGDNQLILVLFMLFLSSLAITFVLFKLNEKLSKNEVFYEFKQMLKRMANHYKKKLIGE